MNAYTLIVDTVVGYDYDGDQEKARAAAEKKVPNRAEIVKEQRIVIGTIAVSVLVIVKEGA